MRDTIKKHSDFIVPENCPTIRTSLFIIKANSTKFPNDARFGLVATKKTFPLAVQRNRAKRLLRAWLIETESFLRPDMDYIFIAKSAILNSNKTDGISVMKKSLESLEK